jgi:hypothetical protein
MTDLATLTIAAQASRLGTCELCATEGMVLAVAAVVRHSRGGAIQMSACDRCARAVRRLVATLGPGPVVASPPVVGQPAAAPSVPEHGLRAAAVVPAPPDPACPPAATGAPRAVAELTSEVVSTDGRSWQAFVYGEPRADGTWVGWLQFREVGGRATRRTRQETSQPDLGALNYWAGGLNPSFVEGAFNRAR